MQIAPLRIVELNPPEMNAATPGITVWRDVAGQDVVFGLTTEEWNWVRVTGAGYFRFPLSSPELLISAEGTAESGATPSTIVDSYYRTVVPMALHAYGLETLHGSAIATPAGAVALCAPPRNGKSTIAFALGQRGHEVLADDSVVLDFGTEGSGPEVVPLPFELRLRRQSAEFFERPSKREVRVAEHSGGSGDRRSLAAVIVLSQGAPEVQVERLSPTAAFKALLDQSQVFSVGDPTRKGEMMRAYLRLASDVPVYRLEYPAGLERLSAICDEVERLAAGAASDSAGDVTIAT